MISRWAQRLAPRVRASALLTGLRRSPRRRAYPLAGLAMAAAALAGLLTTRALEQGRLPDAAWLAAEVAADPAGYLFLGLFAAVAAVGLGATLGAQEDRLRRLAVTDPLTGLPNRRDFEIRLAEEVARGRRYGVALTLLLVDVDRLKEVNDAGGHPAGDDAIRAVAAMLCQSVRVTDRVARYAGDEFTVLLTHTGAADGLGVARRINRAVAELPVAPGAAPLSVSIGVAELAGDDGAALVAAADQALYQAKAAGRGTACQAGVAASRCA